MDQWSVTPKQFMTVDQLSHELAQLGHSTTNFLELVTKKKKTDDDLITAKLHQITYIKELWCKY